MWASIFYIFDLKIYHIQTFCELLGSGLSKSKWAYWKNMFVENGDAVSEKKLFKCDF